MNWALALIYFYLPDVYIDQAFLLSIHFRVQASVSCIGPFQQHVMNPCRCLIDLWGGDNQYGTMGTRSTSDWAREKFDRISPELPMSSSIGALSTVGPSKQRALETVAEDHPG